MYALLLALTPDDHVSQLLIFAGGASCNPMALTYNPTFMHYSRCCFAITEAQKVFSCQALRHKKSLFIKEAFLLL